MMKKLFFVMLLLMPMLAWADCSYPGCFSLEGTMGNNINFAIHAAYWGDNPCLVVGETVYKRQNGKTSSIKLYGSLTDNGCVLYEMVNGKMCGVFSAEMPGPGELMDFDLVDGQQVQGQWSLGEKSYAFNDVRLRKFQGFALESANVDYDKYLHHRDFDERKASGYYGYYDKSTGDSLYFTLRLNAQEDSVRWQSACSNGMCDWDCQFTTPGLKNNSDPMSTSFAPKIDGGEYEMVMMDDVIALFRTNEMMEESDDFIDLAGVYPRRADHIEMRPTRSFDPKDPEAISYVEVSMDVPRTDSQRLNDSIRAWMGNVLGMEIKAGDDLWEAAQQSAANFLENECYEPERDDDGKLPTWQLAWRIVTTGYSDLDARKFINLRAQVSDYMGGAHPMTGFWAATLRRSDGKVMGWTDWFTNPDAVRPLVEKYMKQQNGDVQWNEETLSLPEDAPIFDGANLIFSYGQYEAAPYSDGTPECSIPVKVLLPYLTQGAKNLTK